ncbi:hypothetical protein [Sphingobacterium sp. UT-1RO-CII-1]|uniref:hypothetical protein n=1 Tax=Sphingobacterium sp. UT-1RO-CII-1 TaxID=2995225 RepID=UPI002DD425CF|nr:hypothetical protein [Sphingobacterium sp. UT-1RO-CII-1]
MTVQQIRTSLTKLKSTNEITIKTTNKGTVITIVNYDFYQSGEDEQPTKQPTSNQRITNKQPTDNQQVTTNKNVKNIKNDKNERMKEVFRGAEAQKKIDKNYGSEESTLDDLNSEKEKSSAKKEKVFGKPEFKKALLDEGVLEQHADDWIKVRTAKRASFTQTVIDSLIKECRQNDYPVADAVRVSAEQSWQGFKFSWIKNIENYGKQETRNTAAQSRQQRVDDVREFRLANQQALAERLQKHISGDN